jgi:hypothetical protein
VKRDFCCYGDCHQSRRCPHRPAKPPTRREWLFTVGTLVIVLMASFALSGCGERPASPEGNQQPAFGDRQPVAVYMDHGTGCEYVAADGGHSAITPRIAADGKTHMGCREVRN